MYKIGEFSKLTKVSARMIRYYDKENLLKPSLIGDNGYRFYTDADIKIICKIKELRRYQFSYDEIKNIILNNLENDRNIYLNKLKELKYTLDDYDVLISELENKKNLKVKNNIVNNYDVSISNKKQFYALCEKSLIKYYEIDLFVESAFNKVSKSKVSSLGSYFIMFYENENLAEDICEVEYYQPIAKREHVEGFETKFIEEELHISTLHYGEYETLYNAYIALQKWATLNSYFIKGNFIERYYVDSYLTSCSDEFITEVSVKVTK